MLIAYILAPHVNVGHRHHASHSLSDGDREGVLGGATESCRRGRGRVAQHLRCVRRGVPVVSYKALDQFEDVRAKLAQMRGRARKELHSALAPRVWRTPSAFWLLAIAVSREYFLHFSKTARWHAVEGSPAMALAAPVLLERTSAFASATCQLTFDFPSEDFVGWTMV